MVFTMRQLIKLSMTGSITHRCHVRNPQFDQCDSTALHMYTEDCPVTQQSVVLCRGYVSATLSSVTSKRVWKNYPGIEQLMKRILSVAFGDPLLVVPQKAPREKTVHRFGVRLPKCYAYAFMICM